MMKRICLALVVAAWTAPAMAQDAKWHFVSINEGSDPVAWFISDHIEPFEGGRKKISYGLVMPEGEEDMYDVPARGWVRYQVVYDCRRRESGIVAIDRMRADGQVDSSEPKKLEMREIFDGDDGKYFGFVCENRRNSKVRVSSSQVASSARSLMSEHE
jgi:hypothetical protein